MASPTSTKASQVGWMFVPQYYTFVNKDPAKLHCFYTKKSTLIHGVEGEDSQPCYGQQDIHEKIMSLGYEDCKVFVSTVDSQSSAEGGIIIQVVGELSNRGGAWRKFAQTFFLAEQPNGYFVLNDIFRYIKEESDEDEAVADESSTPSQTGATPAASSNQQQEVTYDQLSNSAIVGGQQSSSSAAPAAAHQDFELAQQHGAPADAAGVTVAPPTEAHQEDARANLEDLANGQTEQQQVVELHEDLTQEQLDSSAAHQQSTQVNGDHSQAEEALPAVPAEAEGKAPTSAPEEAAPAAAPQKTEAKAPAAKASAPAQAQEPPKPSAPKTWANLAAAGQTKWKPQVMATAAGVTSSVPTSSAGASRSSTPAGPSDKTDNSKGEQPFQQQQSRGPNNNNKQQQSQLNTEPRKFINVETPYSIVLENVTEDISHGMLRSRLSEAFAQTNGTRKESAMISYLDIDRRKSTAYVDFVEEWALKKALSKGSVQISDVEVTITEGKGNRRKATGLGPGKGRGQGQGPPKGAPGANAGGPDRGGPRDGQQKSQRGGRGGGKQ